MTIKKISYFCEICKDLNLSHTAKRLYVTQQSLSYVIRTLEQDLKCSLFLRTANGLRLTQQGSYFFERCTHILEELDETCATLRQFAPTSHRKLRIALDACIYNMMMHILPSQCDNYQVEYGYHSVETCLNDVQTGKFDGAILPQKFKTPDLQFTLLFQDPVCAVLPRRHPLAQQDAVSITELSQEPLIIPQIYQGIYPPLLHTCATLGVTFHDTISTPSPLVAIHQCVQGHGILLLDQQSFKNCVVSSPEISILPTKEPLTIDLYCAYPRQQTSPAIRSFLQDIEASAQE